MNRLSSLIFMSVALITSLISSPHASAEQSQEPAKIALVIGNSAYQVGPLKNATRDASLMGDTLQSLGFELLNHRVYHDVTKEQLSLLILEFGDQLKARKGVGLFYFAGHGVQFEGRNFLIPIGAKLDREEYVKIYGVPMDELTSMFNSLQNDINLMILDACRNNPFASKYRSATRGLKLQRAPSDTLIFYATRPGEVSMDGDEKNSPFTTALTKHMRTPGLRLEQVLRETIKEVKAKTYNKQIPWQEGFVLKDFYFSAPQENTQLAASPQIVCPQGTRLTRGACVMEETHCPQGSVKKNGRCVLLSMAQTSAQVSASGSAARPSLISSMPVYAYIGFGLGVAAHIVNFSSSDPSVANPAFYSTYLGYGVGAIGAGVGVWRYMSVDSSPASQTFQPTQIVRQGSPVTPIYTLLSGQF